MANPYMTGQTVYEWSIVSLDGRRPWRATACSSHPTVPTRAVGCRVDILFVCGGVDVQEAVSPLSMIAALQAPAPSGACRSGVHRRLRAGQGRAARQVPRHDPLGESLGAARGVPAHPAERSALQHRPRPLHLLGRRRAARPDAAPGRASSGRASRSSSPSNSSSIGCATTATASTCRCGRRSASAHESLIKVAQLMEENIEKPAVAR
jgi:hypothetical protein